MYSYTRKYMVIVTIHVIMLGCDVHLNFGDLCTASRRVQVMYPLPRIAQYRSYLNVQLTLSIVSTSRLSGKLRWRGERKLFTIGTAVVKACSRL